MATKNEKISSPLVPELTEKQREVLDLLLDHKTSKEIAKALSISPHTVDQRIQFAKRKLGVDSRSEVARLYRELKQTYAQTTYEDSYMVRLANPVNQSQQDEATVSLHPDRIVSDPSGSDVAGNSIVPELFVGTRGKGYRLVAILAIALLTVLLALSGLAIYSSLADFLAS